MDLQLKEKVIIVSGGAKGIGEGIVKVLAAEGAIPVIAGRNEADNNELVELVQSNGGKAFYVVAELTVPEECEKIIKKVLEKFGRIEGLVRSEERRVGKECR